MEWLLIIAVVAILAILAYFVAKRVWGFQFGILEWLSNPLKGLT